MVAAQPAHVCLIPVAYGSSTAWSCVLDPSTVAYGSSTAWSCVLDPSTVAYGRARSCVRSLTVVNFWLRASRHGVIVIGNSNSNSKDYSSQCNSNSNCNRLTDK